MEILNLNLIPTGANPVAHVSQYDEGRVIRFNLFEGSAVYTLDGTETIECDVKKPDGNVVTLSVTNTSDSYVEVASTLQMCACAGESLGDIKITKGAVVLATLNFILDVERSPLENGIESDSAIHDLEQQIYDAVADQYDADSVIFDNAPTAGHGVGYVVTSEGTPDELEDLTDVTYTGTPAVGEAVVWDGSKWTNGTVSTVGSIDDLNDVDTTGKAEGDSLRYNSTAQEWEARPVVYEMTLAEYTALGGDYTGYEDSLIVLTDAPNLNATANDLSMGSAPYASGSVGKAITSASADSSITFTPADTSKVSLTSLTAYRNGAVLILNLYLNAVSSIPANSEWRIGDFTGTNAGLGAISGVVVNRADSGLLGSYCFTTGNQRLYTTMNSNVASGTNLYLTIVTFTA